MSKKLIFLVLLLTFCLASSVQAGTIIWVDEGAANSFPGWQTLLEDAGHTVTNRTDMQTLDADSLNEADLVIVSRDTNSGDYDDDDEVTQWNNLTIPVIQASAYLIRSSRWQWINGTGTPGTEDNMLIVEDHLIFEGVGSAGGEIAMATSEVDISDATDGGNGQVLATHTDGRLWIVLWEDTDTPFYDGTTQVPAAPRMWFAAGFGNNGDDKGGMNLTDDGQIIFLNAVRYMLGVSKQEKAFKSDPKDGAYIADTWVNLSWRAGGSAVTHDVYIGEDFEAVSEGAEGTFIGNQADTFIVAGFPGFPYPDGLVPGITYYWRIDEVNDTEPNSPWKGDIWSFTVPPKTAYLPNPVDTGEAVAVNTSLTWTPGFGAKLHTIYFGDSLDEVANAEGGLPQGAATYDPGELKQAKAYYWRVDEFDVVGTHKGDVWSFTTEGAVAVLDPVNGAVDVTQTPVLTWAPGLGASHEVYFGADATSLELKGSGNLGSESFDPGQLEWNTTYYWRVDEVNNTNADSPWTGPLWSFTTANFLVVDDFESYNDLDEGEPGSNRIYLAWIDGFDNPATNGSVVGNLNAPFAEQTIVNNGIQSMPMAYDNAVGKSEATLTLTSNRDWTVNGVTTLTIWFRGDSGNTAETLYVALNGNARVDNDNPDAATITRWTEWNIDLQAFADQGVNLANVNSITLGLSSVTGGTGMMYFDDIRLYPPAQ
jgi:hypothetical protein